MSEATIPLALRRALPSDAPFLVALSGGLDSCVLLHALRFPLRRTLSAAHFDHGMRGGSAADADWVRGLCRAWRIEFVEGTVAEGRERADPVLASEADARQARYAFLRRAAADRAAVLLTAHHADDQAETVLFRVLRGTGIEGLAGIPHHRTLPAGGADREGTEHMDVQLVRPLLHVWREELEAYARRHRVPWRLDPTNEGLGYARNALRNRILPDVEELVAPGARRSLVRLAEIAGREAEAWDTAMRFVLPVVDARSPVDARGGSSCDRRALLELGPELSARVVRVLAADIGRPLDLETTRRALDFIAESQSGRRIELGGGAELGLERDRVVLTGPVPAVASAPDDTAP